MRPGARTIALCAALLGLLLGCASYRPPGVEVANLGFHARAETDGDDHLQVTTAVLTDEETVKLTGVNLESRWVQMLWVEVTNRDERPYWLLFPSLDPDYFSPDEVAYSFHNSMSQRGYRALGSYFRKIAFQNPIYPGETRSGFVFVHRDEDAKEVDVRLLSVERLEQFTFYHEVPGLQAQTFRTTDQIYSEGEFRELEEEELRFALQYLPCCTTDEDGGGEGDPLNLVLIGNTSDLFPVFVRRGWHPAENTYWGSVWKTVNSFLFGEHYRYSPVSPLFALGRKQDIALQRARGTIHQRNHLRLWLTPLRYRGKSIWVGQISRDIGVRFTLRSGVGVTHKIDPDVDETRNAIVQDVLFSKGLVKLGFVRGVGPSRPDEPHENLTGDPYFTDGMRAVLLLDQRIYPLTEVEFFGWDLPSEREFRPASGD